MGVDIIQNCEVKGIKRNGDNVEGIETTKGFIKTKKLVLLLQVIQAL
jgi:sarcosine oxidase subunit beta